MLSKFFLLLFSMTILMGNNALADTDINRTPTHLSYSLGSTNTTDSNAVILSNNSLSTIEPINTSEQKLSNEFIVNSVNHLSSLEIKAILLEQLKRDGYLSDENFQAIKSKYLVTSDNSIYQSGVNEKGNITKHITIINFVKLVAILFLLYAFRGMLAFILKNFWHIFTLIPLYVYQLILFVFTIVGTFMPSLYYNQHTFFIAFFCSFANLILIAWIAKQYPMLIEQLKKIFTLGIDPILVLLFWVTLYFNQLTFLYQSQIFGLISTVLIFALISFSIIKFFSHKNSRITNHQIFYIFLFSHIAILATYIGLSYTSYAQYTLFYQLGFEYYPALSIGLSLIVFSSPGSYINDNSNQNYTSLFIFFILSIAAGYIYIHHSTVIGTIFLGLFVLQLFIWLGYLSAKINFIFATFVIGVLLYVGATFMENYMHLIVFVK